MKKKLNCILLIDDDEPTNYLNKMILDGMDCACCVKVASSGAQAMKIIENTKTPADEKTCDPELIFLDINMPAMNGWEFLQRYKSNEQRKEVVIIMLTTSLNPDDKILAEQSEQIKAFVSKPLTRERVQDIIDRYFIRNKN